MNDYTVTSDYRNGWLKYDDADEENDEEEFGIYFTDIPPEWTVINDA